MGCDQSRQVRVQPVGPTELADRNNKLKKCTSENDPIEYDIDDNNTENQQRRRRKKKVKSAKGGRSMGSRDSLGGDRTPDSDRGGSAGSKKSTDSGLGEDNHAFITENSDPNKVKEIEAGFKERDDLDLGITGTALPTRNSAKDKARLEEAMILQKLRDEGLISRPNAEKSGGVSFEIVETSPNKNVPTLPSLPPVRLAKLEKRRKKKRPLTEEEIMEKLQRAEARRKKKEQARLDKIKDLDKADQTAALESFAEYQKKREVQVSQKMESVADNRERRLQEIREKIKERERRAEEVRRRKQQQADMTESQEQLVRTDSQVEGDLVGIDNNGIDIPRQSLVRSPASSSPSVQQ